MHCMDRGVPHLLHTSKLTKDILYLKDKILYEQRSNEKSRSIGNECLKLHDSFKNEKNAVRKIELKFDAFIILIKDKGYDLYEA